MPDKKTTAFDLAQFNAIYPDGVERHYWNRCRNTVIRRAIDSIDDAGQLLEVGCGKGLVVSHLRSRGYAISGVELADVAPAPEVGPFVRTGTNALDLPDEERAGIKTILLLDVIEHIEDPVAFLKELRGGFPNLCHWIITVPAMQGIFSNYDEFNNHFRRYNIRSLSQHIGEAGGRIRRSAYFFHLLYPAAWLQLKVRGKRKTSFAVPRGIANWVHRVLGQFFCIEYLLVPGSWPGTSLIAVVDLQAERAI